MSISDDGYASGYAAGYAVGESLIGQNPPSVTVPTIIQSQQNYATAYQQQADAFIGTVADFATNIEFSVDGIPNLDYQWQNLTTDALARFDELRPPVAQITPYIPSAGDLTAPIAPTFSFSSTSPVSVPDFLNTSPNISIPQAPDTTLPIVPVTPAILDVSLPAAPSYDMPVAPTLDLVQIPSAPSIEIPSFTSTLPIDDLVAPSNTFSFFEEAYQSALLDNLRAKLLLELEQGGYGIEPLDEVALWERARAREVSAAQTQIDEAWRRGAQRSFPQPIGEIFITVERAQQDLQDKVSSLSRDISLKRADLYVENRKFVIEQTRELEQVLINYHNSVMERALNVNRAMIDASIAIFNAQVSRYNARLDAYKTEASVFGEKIRASLSQLEIYKTVVQAKGLELEAQRTAVEIYRAKLSGIEQVVNIFRTRMEAANVEANIQRTRFDAFRASIDAYAQQVQAKVAEFNMFEARIRGETAKVNVFEAQVSAYNGLVQASKTRADIQVANLRAETEQAQAKILAYRGQLDGYKTGLDAKLDVAKVLVDSYKADTAAWSTSIDGLKSAYQLQLTEVNTDKEVNIQNAELKTKVVLANLEALKHALDLRLNAAEFGTTFYGNMVSSILGSVNTLATQITNS